MKHMKKAICFIMIILIAIGSCGCVNNNKQNSAEITKEKVLEYLNSKYDDAFEAQGYSSNSWAYNYSSVTFSSNRYNNAVFEVRVYKNDDDSLSFKDNYYHLYMYDDAVEYIKDIFNDGTAEIKIRFPGSVWSDELNEAKSFAEWKSFGNVAMDTFIITNAAVSDSAQKSLLDALVETKIKGTVSFITTAEQDLLVSSSLDDVLNNQSKLVDNIVGFYINSNYEIEKI